MRGGARHGHGVPGVVDDGVVVADAADQRAPLETRRQPQRARLSQMLLPAERISRRPAGRRGRCLRPRTVVPTPVGQREQEPQRLDQVRRQRRQRQLALVQRLPDQPELELLEVAQPAVEHLRRAARGARREVTGLDERDLQPAGRGVERGAGADDAAADDDDVELFAAEPFPARSRCSGPKRVGPLPGPGIGSLTGLLLLLIGSFSSTRLPC